MSYVDDDSFDEGSGARERSPRRRSAPSGRARQQRRAPSGGGGGGALQQRGTRLGILAALALVILLILVTSIRGCQRDRLVDSYKSYLAASNAIADESATIGTELRAVLENKSFKAQAQVTQGIGELRTRSETLLARAQKLDPPDALRAPHNTLVTALEYRRDGLTELPQAIDAAIAGKGDPANQLATLARPLQALGASDVIYQRSFVGPANAALLDDKVKDVTVKASDFFPGDTYDMTSREGAQSILTALRQVKPSSGSSTGTDASGSKHGLGIVKVEAVQGGKRTQLVQGAATPTVIADTPDLTFEATIEDSGDFIESNVTITMTYTSEIDTKGAVQTQTIDQISPGAAAQKKVTFKAPKPPYYRSASTITVRAEPVPGETVTNNNEYSYPVKFEISG